MPLSGRSKRPILDVLLNGSLEEHFKTRSYEEDTMETIEAFYDRNPHLYNPNKIRRIDGKKHHLSDKQKEHAILHLDSIIRDQALEELNRREAERAQRFNVAVLEEPTIPVPTGIFFELIEAASSAEGQEAQNLSKKKS